MKESERARTSTFVENVSKSYDEINSSIRIPLANFAEPKIDPNVLEYTEVQKHVKPTRYASEIRHRLLLDGALWYILMTYRDGAN